MMVPSFQWYLAWELLKDFKFHQKVYLHRLILRSMLFYSFVTNKMNSIGTECLNCNNLLLLSTQIQNKQALTENWFILNMGTGFIGLNFYCQLDRKSCCMKICHTCSSMAFDILKNKAPPNWGSGWSRALAIPDQTKGNFGFFPFWTQEQKLESRSTTPIHPPTSSHVGFAIHRPTQVYHRVVSFNG